MGSSASGFKLDFGEDGTGWQFKYLTRGGGYYFNVGCSDLIVKGEIGLAQFSDIAEFVAEGARMRTGETLAADLIVLATGYKGQEHLVSKLFGDDVAARVGPIWGFGDGQELRNMFTRTRSRASGSSPAVSPSAASTPSISRCRSRPARSVCCRKLALLRTLRPCRGPPIRSPLPSIDKSRLLSPCRGSTSLDDERFGAVHRFVSRTGRDARLALASRSSLSPAPPRPIRARCAAPARPGA